MTPFRWLIVLFWVFIGGMLIWQFSSYNSSIEQAAVDHPQDNHFYFYPPGQAPAVNPVTANPNLNGADVRQVSFTVEANKPTLGSYTGHIVLKNIGTAKATNVQVMVHPFRGAIVGDVDVGVNAHPLSDTDYRAQIGQWVNFPDIPPGESSTEDYVFLGQNGLNPGANPDPQIVFQTENAKP